MSIYSILINIFSNFLFMNLIGIAGIALSTTFVSIFSLLYYQKKFKQVMAK